MFILYTYNKRKNLVVFLDPEVHISKEGTIIFEKTGSYVFVKEVRHLIYSKEPNVTLGYLDTIYVNKKIISQKFFPFSGVVATSERKSPKAQKSGQFFDQLVFKEKIMNREKELEKTLKDILDAFWDMSPLEYAQSKGLSCMSDEEGDRILQRARELLKEEGNSKREDIIKRSPYLSRFSIKLVCKEARMVTASLGGLAGICVELDQVDPAEIISELYELFGGDILIDFIKNGS